MQNHSLQKTIQGNLYDYPKYYDLVYGSDWKAEFDFLCACFDKHAYVEVWKLFEPACGTGRLLARFAAKGFDVNGLDLNPRAVEYCNQRLTRHGFQASAVVGDMTDFRLPKRVDAAFNTINSFRHLATEAQARSHLQCVARSLRIGGIYVLGLHLTPTVGVPIQEESWSARRGNLAVLSRMWVTDCDLKKRRETVGMSFDIYTPTRQTRIEDQTVFRTYTLRQMAKLLSDIAEFEITAVYDFSYDINCPIQLSPQTEDVVYVLRKRSK